MKRATKTVNVLKEVTFEMLFGEVVQSERVKRGLNQIEASEAAGLSQATWSRIERGQISAPLDTLRRISIALDMPLSKLLRITEQRWEVAVV